MNPKIILSLTLFFSPGLVVTEIFRSVGITDKEAQAEKYKEGLAKSLMNRIGTADDIANLVSFLASNDAVNITGSIMVSDSGALLK